MAIGRQVPIISIRMGMDPYGFIGKYQGLSGTNKSSDTLALDVYELLWANPSLKGKLTESLVMKFEKAGSFQHANKLMGFVAKIESASPEIIDRLEKAPQGNRQVLEANNVKKMLPQLLRRLRGGGA